MESSGMNIHDLHLSVSHNPIYKAERHSKIGGWIGLRPGGKAGTNVPGMASV